MVNRIDLSRVDLNLLVLFEAVLQEGHVGRAATRLHLTSSAVSHGLGRLRRMLNDPLFLRTPKGVVASARALELAEPIAEILARVRTVVAVAEPFDPSTATRRFAIGAPDGVSTVVLPPLLERLRTQAPGVDIAVHQLLPARGETAAERAWRPAFDGLEARTLDIALVPIDAVPPRFHATKLYDDRFVIAARRGHPALRRMDLARYCTLEHLVVSLGGDARGIVDHVLAEQGLTRRIALTVPNFLFALAALEDTDLVAAMPRRFVEMHGARFGIAMREAPFDMPSFRIQAIATRAAMMDAGVAWLMTALQD